MLLSKGRMGLQADELPRYQHGNCGTTRLWNWSRLHRTMWQACRQVVAAWDQPWWHTGWQAESCSGSHVGWGAAGQREVAARTHSM